MFKMEKFQTTILEVFNEKLDIIDKLLDKLNGTSFDFQPLVANFTLDSIGKIAFGCDLNCLTTDGT